MEAAIDDGAWLLMQWLEYCLDPKGGEPPVRLVADTRAHLEKVAPGYMAQLANDLNTLIAAHARGPAPRAEPT